jgi:hypothetical protein
MKYPNPLWLRLFASPFERICTSSDFIGLYDCVSYNDHYHIYATYHDETEDRFWPHWDVQVVLDGQHTGSISGFTATIDDTGASWIKLICQVDRFIKMELV